MRTLRHMHLAGCQTLFRTSWAFGKGGGRPGVACFCWRPVVRRRFGKEKGLPLNALG